MKFNNSILIMAGYIKKRKQNKSKRAKERKKKERKKERIRKRKKQIMK